MRRFVVSAVSFSATLAMVGLLWCTSEACLDTTPIVVIRDARDPDASCLKCLQQPEGCADLIASCETDTKCKPAYACMVAQTCLDLRTIDDKIKCGLPCAQEAGVASVSDPIVTTYLVGLVACGQEKCAEPCNLIDASIGF